MYTIAVCDDDPNDLGTGLEFLDAYAKERPSLDIRVTSFLTGAELLTEVASGNNYDIYIMDVIMPDDDGISIGMRLRELGGNGEIIYLTSSNEYASESYDAGAFFYILKPAEQEKLFSVLDGAIDKRRRSMEKHMMVRTPNGLRLIPMENILMVERVGRVMRCYCTDGVVDSSTMRSSLREAASSLLADPRFHLCGASLVFNLRHVTGVKSGVVTMDTKSQVSIPRRAYAGLKEAWENYWLKRG